MWKYTGIITNKRWAPPMYSYIMSSSSLFLDGEKGPETKTKEAPVCEWLFLPLRKEVLYYLQIEMLCYESFPAIAVDSHKA